MATEDIEITSAGETAEAEPQSAEALRTYPLAPGYNVNVRSGPGTHFSIVRTLPAGSRVPIYCQCPGESVSGPYGTTTIWDNISNGQFVSDAYVNTGTDGYVAPRCS
ncbi:MULTISPECIES: peptidase [Streptomyces]|uniref:Peptidase n=1 Tax=Streptomyces dengpaensis TaxID=2049881 RepID=A0ABN5I325_9ACTN|nr:MULTISPECIES: peptidase [Streptomyces]AVH57277.1 peptidase [Streptomyces dengpaensis]PIB03672.1 peptidase [Streptomyces sp. HG99]